MRAGPDCDEEMLLMEVLAYISFGASLLLLLFFFLSFASSKNDIEPGDEE